MHKPGNGRKMQMPAAETADPRNGNNFSAAMLTLFHLHKVSLTSPALPFPTKSQFPYPQERARALQAP